MNKIASCYICVAGVFYGEMFYSSVKYCEFFHVGHRSQKKSYGEWFGWVAKYRFLILLAFNYLVIYAIISFLLY